MRAVRWGAAAVLLLAAAGAPAAEEGGAGTWAFRPGRDEFRADALLDLRGLNEKEAGESGFVKVGAEGQFLLGNGKPVRFWAVNTNVGREEPFAARPLWGDKAPDLAHFARFLAKRGVNMVRLNAFLNPGPEGKATDFNHAERDWIWRTAAAMKKEGIYSTISPYWAASAKVGPNWGVPGVTKTTPADGLLFFEPAMQEGYKAWMRALYATPNPYTGIRLADDPSVAIIQLQNEDSLLFWTFNNIQGAPRERLSRLFGDFLKEKGDDFAGGIAALDNIWELTQERSGARGRRLDDMTEFLSRTMYEFNREMEKFLREEIGCKQLINAGNWQTADMEKLNDAERWSYTANEVMAVNRYFTGIHTGKDRGWAIERGDEFTSPSALLEPRELPVNLKQVKGFPMLVTESGWVMPDAYASEGPFLVAAYESLAGVAGYYWFAASTDDWTPPRSANGYLPSQEKWMFEYPDVLGGFPAAALMYRMGYIRRGTPAVEEERPLEEIFERRKPMIAEGAGFDPNRESGNVAPALPVKERANPLAFLAGPVETVYGARGAGRAADMKRYIDEADKTVRSDTGELTLNYGEGSCVLDAPKAQGVTGFFKGRKEFKTSDAEFDWGNDYGTALVVSMDGRPIGESGKLLAQVTTQSRPTGWEEKPTTIKVTEGEFPGFEVVSFGKAPWEVRRAKLTLRIRNGGLTRATVLDADGNAAGEAKMTKRGGGVELEFPEEALYVVLQ